MAEQKKEWNAPRALRYGTFVEATGGVQPPDFFKSTGTGDEFAPSNLSDWAPLPI